MTRKKMIKLFYGPMKCGKSAKLIEEYEKSESQIAILPKAVWDAGKTEIKSRNGKKISDIYSLRLFQKMKFGSKNIFVDEAQFLDAVEMQILEELSVDRNVFVASLQLDFQNKTFENFSRFYEITDEKETFFCLCEECKKEKADFNVRIGENGMIETKGNVFDLNKAKYKTICESCYKNLVVKSHLLLLKKNW